jgi:hypothetical protein
MEDFAGKFFMIARGDTEVSVTTKRHLDYSEAKREMERLCQKEGKPFYLLEAIERVSLVEIPKPIKWQKVFP